MKIESIEIIRVAMPLIYPFRTAFGDDDKIESVLLKMSSGNFFGWGEASPFGKPAYSSECAATVFKVANDFIAPLLLGKDIKSANDIQKLTDFIKGNYFAKASFDLAWWDLYSRVSGLPLWQVLGGIHSIVNVGADIGVMESIDKLLKEIDAAIKQGYKRIKLKYRSDWEFDMIHAVRTTFPKTTIHIDCNSAYTLDHIDMFKKLDKFELAMIEQPLMHDDLIDHATLQASIQTPICLDESITSVSKARKAIQIKACRWINIKPGRVGGITNAIAIHNIAQEADIPCWIGGMLESAIGASHCLALATLPNIKYPSDIFPTSRFYKKDLGYPSIQHSAPGELCPSMNPGIGTEPDQEVLNKCILERVILK